MCCIVEGLLSYGFDDEEVVERAMLQLVEKPVVSEAVGLAACLDWLCMHVANDLLPSSLKEHKAKEGLKVGQVFAPPASRTGTQTPTRTATETTSAKVRLQKCRHRRLDFVCSHIAVVLLC